MEFHKAIGKIFLMLKASPIKEVYTKGLADYEIENTLARMK